MLNPIKKIFAHKKISVLLVVALAVGGYYSYKALNPQKTAVSYTTETAQIGTVIQSVSGTGQISASNKIDLKAKTAGDVALVNVSSGQAVKQGDVLVKIDSSDATQAVKDAQIALETAQLNLEKLLKPVDELTLMQAQNSLTQAQDTKSNAQDSLAKSYDDAFNDIGGAFLDLPAIMIGLQNIVQGSDSTVVQSSANYLEYYYNSVNQYSAASGYLRDANAAYAKARVAYDQNTNDYKKINRSSDVATIESLLNETYDTTKQMADAIKSVTNLVQFYEDKAAENNVVPQAFADTQLTSLASYSSKVNSHLAALLSDKNTIKDAKDTIVSSDRTITEKTLSLKNTEAGADELDIRAQKIAVDQKAAALSDAQEKLASCVIAAPFDGTVSSVGVTSADSVASGGVVATLITNSQIAGISLNEVDVAKIKTGQLVTLTFDAIDGLTLTGKVSEIDTVGAVSQGVVSYGTKIGFDTQDDRVKPGMSVTASIITAAKHDVLTVPNAAVKTDNSGAYYVEVMSGSGIPSRKSVETGLANDELTEITSGLNEGDTVVVSSTAATASKAAATTSGFNPFGGTRAPGR